MIGFAKMDKKQIKETVRNLDKISNDIRQKNRDVAFFVDKISDDLEKMAAAQSGDYYPKAVGEAIGIMSSASRFNIAPIKKAIGNIKKRLEEQYSESRDLFIKKELNDIEQDVNSIEKNFSEYLRQHEKIRSSGF